MESTLYYQEPVSLDKYEFQEQDKYKYIYQDPRQLLLRNLISKNTIYDNILLFWGTGVGKSCAAITIAEGFKEYVSNMDRKILVLVKNSNIERNFRNELLSDCSNNAYISDEYNTFLKTSNDKIAKKELLNKVTRKINKVYNFMTYGTFVNQVLGMKVFEKDSFGRNTTKQKKNKGGVGIRKIPNNPIIDLNNTVIIIDEAHNVTNNDVYISLETVLKKSYNYRLVLLTATPIYDNPKEIIEISNLLNMNTPEKLLPIRNDLFKENANSGPLMIKKNMDSTLLKSGLTIVSDECIKTLITNMKGKVSYLEPNTSTFPQKIDMGTLLQNEIGSIRVVLCKMSDYQYNVYLKALSLDSKITTFDEPSFDTPIHLDIDNDNLNDNLTDNVTDNVNEQSFIRESHSRSSSLYKNSSDASTMTYPNNTFGKDGFLNNFKKSKNSSEFIFLNEKESFLQYNQVQKYSSKLYNLLSSIATLKEDAGTIFIYSNYVNFGGTSLIKQLLLANGYTQFKSITNSNNFKTFMLYDDSVNIETREQQRKIFNSESNNTGKYIKIIIGSPIISEGITLKNVRQVHILEPSWNMSKINQIIGRAVRHHSHDSLPINERTVEIYKYCSVGPKNTSTNFIDKEKYILSEEKDRSNKVIERLLKTLAFDCEFNNKNKNGNLNGSAACDYTTCDYNCLIKSNKSSHVDKFTYNMYINFFSEFDIDINISFIRNLFKTFFVWSIPDIISHIHQLEPIISIDSIYTALKQMIDNKTILLDMYDRDGFLIQKSDYIIFNPVNIDINSSIYSKTLDFMVDSNKYTLNDYIKLKIDGQSQSQIKQSQKEKIKKEPLQTIQITLSDEILEINNKIIKNKYKIYGSYRSRATKKSNSIFGPIDNKFRIIDLRNDTTLNDDKRKNISGMAATSYNKKDLIDMIKHLKITSKQIQQYLSYPRDNIIITNLGIEQLVDIIQKDLAAKKLILQ